MNTSVQETYTFLKTLVGVMFAVKLIVGVLLIFFGVLLAVWTFQIIYTLIQTQDEVLLLEKITRAEPEGISIQIPSGEIVIPPIFIGYGVLTMLLLISLGLMRGVLSAGVNLVRSDIKTLLERLGEELARLWSVEKE